MKVAHLSEPAEERVVFRDGLGLREVRDAGTGEATEWLHLDPAFAAVDTPLRDRVTRLAKLQHVKFARIISLEPARKDRGPILISSHVPGTRLAEALEMAGHGLLSFEPGAGLQILREVLGALAVLHDSRNVAHGALGPERVVITPTGRVVMVEHVLAQALDRLQRPRHQLWREWRIPTPPAAGPVRFDMHTDLAQAGILALAVLLGRPLDEDEYPHRLRGLLPLVQERLARSPAAAVAGDVVAFLERLAPVDSRRAFKTVREAQQAYEGLVAVNAASMGVTPTRVKAMFAAVTAMSVTAAPALAPAVAAQTPAPENSVASIIAVTPPPAVPLAAPLDTNAEEAEEVAAVGADAAPAPDIDIEALLALEAELEGGTSAVAAMPETIAASVEVAAAPPPAWPDLDVLAQERAELERQFADLVAAVAPVDVAPIHLVPDTPVSSESLVDARVLWSSMPAGDQEDAVGASDPVVVPLASEESATAWLAEPLPTPAVESDGAVETLAVAASEASTLAGATEHTRDEWWREALPWRDDQRLDGHEDEVPVAIDVVGDVASVEASSSSAPGLTEEIGPMPLEAVVVAPVEIQLMLDAAPEADTKPHELASAEAPGTVTATELDDLPLTADSLDPQISAVAEPRWAWTPSDAPAEVAPAEASFEAVADDAADATPVDDPPVDAPPAEVATWVVAVEAHEDPLPADASLPDDLPLWFEGLGPQASDVLASAPAGIPADAPEDTAVLVAHVDAPADDAAGALPADDGLMDAAGSWGWRHVEVADRPDAPTVWLDVDVVENATPIPDACDADIDSSLPEHCASDEGAFGVETSVVADASVLVEAVSQLSPDAADAPDSSSTLSVVADAAEGHEGVPIPDALDETIGAPADEPADEAADERVDEHLHGVDQLHVADELDEVDAFRIVAEEPPAEPSIAEPPAADPTVDIQPVEVLTPALPPSMPEHVPEVVIVDDGHDRNAWDRLPSELPAVSDDLASLPAAAAAVAAAPAASAAAKKRRRRARRKKGEPVVVPADIAPLPALAPTPVVDAPPMPLSLTPALQDAGTAETNDEGARGVGQVSLVNREVPAWTAPDWTRLPETPLAVATVALLPDPLDAAPVDFNHSDRLPPAAAALAARASGEDVQPPPAPGQVAGPQGAVAAIGVESTRPFEQEIRAVGMPDTDDRQLRGGRLGISSVADPIGPTAATNPRATSEPWSATSLSPVAGRGINWRRLIAASVFIALFQGVAFAAWWWVQPGARGTLVVQTGKTGVEVLLDDKMVGRTPFREDITPGRHKLKLREGRTVREMPVEISVGVVTTQAIDWPASGAGRGNLQVTSNPAGAEIFVSGRSRGKAPQLLENLPAGDQVVMLRGDAGSVTVRAHVLAGETSPLEVKIFAGWIQVDAAVELNLLLNGREKIGSTMDGQILLPPGVHRVLVLNESLNVRQWLTLTVEPGAVKRVPLIIEPGTLTLQEEAEVFVDGASAGTTPGTITIAPGTHDITIRQADGTERRQAMTVRARQRVEF